MKKFMFMTILAFMSIAMNAQSITGTWRMEPKPGEEIVLAKNVGVFMPRPEAVVDKKTKKSTAVWG